MLTETASVLARDGSTLRLRTSRKAACGGCSLKAGCGQYLLLSPDDELVLEDCAAARGQHLQPGDQVELGLPAGSLSLLATLFYGVPLLSLLLATAGAVLLGAAESRVMLAALGGLLGGVWAARALLRRNALRSLMSPQISRRAVVEPEDTAAMAAAGTGTP